MMYHVAPIDTCAERVTPGGSRRTSVDGTELPKHRGGLSKVRA
jgi:hypothetical protein